MSACERYEADLSALLDGELHDPAREEELRAHMDVCEDCRMLYETFALLHEEFTAKSLAGCALIGAGTLLMVL